MAWMIDPAHTRIDFSVKHMMIATVRGTFGKFSGTVNVNDADLSLSTVEGEIESGSLSTGEPNRDAHLRSPDFFDAEHYPTASFKSTKVEKTGQNQGHVAGELTIRGTTHPVTLEVEYAGQGAMWGRTSAGFNAQGKINRKDWGLSWNQNLESGGLLVGEVVTITIELEIVKQPEAAGEKAAA